MISFSINLPKLEAEIDRQCPTWRSRAARRTSDLATGKRRKITNIWSEIKNLYVSLQGKKCAFCEKWIEDQPVEQHIEHFRPKNRIRKWTVPKTLKNEGIVLTQSVNSTEAGYRLLAYHLLNYSIACTSCNSVLKKDYFPIAGARDCNAIDPTALAGELAYLICPIDAIENAQDLIEFYGLSPRPKQGGFQRKRALVTIELFQLDDPNRRKDLILDRAEWIEKLYFALKERDNPNSSIAEKQQAIKVIARLTSERFRHANCLRCYQDLWATNRPEAQSVYLEIHNFLVKHSP
jgi:hypothetical protein